MTGFAGEGIVFGAGFLGTKIAAALEYGLCKLNVCDANSIAGWLDAKKPAVVINAVGKTGRPNIDWCESHKEETVRSNITGAVNLCLECSKRGIYFVHLGSGCIYYGDNNGRGYSEDDEPNFYGPQFYAKTKIIAEKILKEFQCLQLRLRMPINDKPHERNLIDKLRKYPRVIDVKNSMTTVPHMLEAIKTLINKRSTGIFNLTNPGTTSAMEIMQLYKEIVDPGHKFEIMSIDELDRITAGKRSNCILSSEKLKMEGIELPEIHDAVKSCLVNYKSCLKWEIK